MAIARMALEPLAVIAGVCHRSQRDALALPLHPLQKQLPPEELLSALHQTLITVVNQVRGQTWLGGLSTRILIPAVHVRVLPAFTP